MLWKKINREQWRHFCWKSVMLLDRMAIEGLTEEGTFD